MDVSDLASIFGVTDKTIREWTAQGMPIVKSGARGRGRKASYSLRPCVEWYFREKAFDDQRQRLAAAQAEKVEHENSVRRGELADMREVEKFWTDCIANARAKLLQLPSRLAAEMPPGVDQALVTERSRRMVNEALTELAEYSPDKAAP